MRSLVHNGNLTVCNHIFPFIVRGGYDTTASFSSILSRSIILKERLSFVDSREVSRIVPYLDVQR